MADASVATSKTFFGHPRGLATLFFTEMWERFSYYGGRALLILYMTDEIVNGGRGMTVLHAGALYGLYTSMVYVTNLPGGWIADKFLGARNAVFYGGILIAVGNLFLAMPYDATFYLGLGFIALGTGLLKPNVSTMVGSLYEKGDIRRDSGFTIFYMGINIGAGIAPFIIGYMGQNIAWRLGFAGVAVGMILGLIQYRMGAKYLGDAGVHRPAGTPEGRARERRSLYYGLLAVTAVIVIPILLNASGVYTITIDWVRNLVGVVLIALPLVYFGFLFAKGGFTKEERGRIVAIIIFYIAAALFWGSFEQAGSTLNLFADRFTDNRVLGWEFPSTWWQSVNAIYIVLLAPVFAWLWIKLASIKREPSTPVKFALGLLFVGLGFLLLVPAAKQLIASGEGAKVGVQWLLGVYLIHTIGELCLSPVGLSAMTKLAPERIVGQMMGIWFLGAATGNFIGGNVGGLFETFPLDKIFMAVFATSAVAALLMFVLVPWMRRRMGGIH
jgi:POT family proton-dependent oligopeptide transporter